MIGLMFGTVIGVILGLFGAYILDETIFKAPGEGLCSLLLTRLAPVSLFGLPWTIEECGDEAWSG